MFLKSLQEGKVAAPQINISPPAPEVTKKAPKDISPEKPPAQQDITQRSMEKLEDLGKTTVKNDLQILEVAETVSPPGLSSMFCRKRCRSY